MLVKLDTRGIHDWESFHDAFASAFGFPDFYGRNMDAWIDCMSSLDSPEDGLTSVHSPPGGVVTLELEHINDFVTRCPEQLEAILNCSAFVNWNRLERGYPAVLALSYYKSQAAAAPHSA